MQIGVYNISAIGKVTVVQTSTIFVVENGKVNINLYKKHASLIVHFNRYAQIFTCQKCNMKFNKLRYLHQHFKALKPCTKVNFAHIQEVYITVL